jgi:uncharacterized phage-associated protein
MFNETKVTQAAARLIEQAGGAMNYMVLIKMLYLADRASLIERGRPITWDEIVAMKLGPVLSKVHDLATEMPNPAEPQYWKIFISEQRDYKVTLISSPGDEELSENEIVLLDSIFEEYKQYLNRPFDLVRLLHSGRFPEIPEVEKGSSESLTYGEILGKIGLPEEQRKAILDEISFLSKDCI